MNPYWHSWPTLAVVTGTAALLTLYVIFGPDQLTSAKKRRNKTLGAPRGLRNVGNSCFLNATLQALAACRTFVDWLESTISQNDVKNGSLDLRNAVYRTIEHVNQSTNEPDKEVIESGELILSVLRSKGWRITSEEQDAHEMLQLLLTSIEEELEVKTPSDLMKDLLFVQITPEAKEKTVDNNNSGILLRPCVSTKNFTPDNVVRSPSVNPFNGSITSKLTFQDGRQKSPVSSISCNNITLTLPNKYTSFSISLDKLLQSYISREQVEGEKMNMVKQLSFGKLPKCLCFHIQRTSYQHGFPTKRNDFVNFPILLDMNKYAYASQLVLKNRIMSHLMTETKNDIANKTVILTQTLYNLCAVIVHLGEINSGHYITYRRGPSGSKAEKKWFMTSDTAVQEVKLNVVLQSQAYILIYERLNQDFKMENQSKL